MESPRSSWNGIDLLTLRLLLTACEESNLAKAAARESIALSAMSKRIKLLEERFGVELLHRHDRGVRPTATTTLILPHIQGMFALLDQIAADLRATSRGEVGFVRVQAHMTAMSGLLPGNVARFLKMHPKIDVELDEATSDAIIHSVQVGTCDIGMVSGTADVQGLRKFQWAQDELVALLPLGNPLAARGRVQFAELLQYPFIALQRESALLTLFRRKSVEIGIPLSERTHVTSFDVAKKMVRSGLGVTVIPAGSVTDDQSGLVVRPLADDWALRSLVLCVRGEDRLPHSAALFLDFLLNQPKQRPQLPIDLAAADEARLSE